MHTALLGAFKGYSGARDLGKSVDVVRLDAERFLDILTHRSSPGLSAEDTCLERNGVGCVAHFLEVLAYVSGVRGSTAEHRCLEVGHELYLSLGVARGHGKRKASNLVRAAVKTGAAREKSVAVAYLNYVLLVCACRDKCARTAVLPKIYVVLSIISYNSSACSTRGRLNSHTVLKRNCKHAVGICLAEIGFLDKRKLVEILDTVNVLGANALLVHKIAVVGNVRVNVLYLLYELLGLQLFDLLNRHRFYFRLIILSLFHLGILLSVGCLE